MEFIHFMGTKIGFFVFSIMLILGCQVKKEDGNEVEDYEVYVNQIINSFAKEMNKEFGLKCSGSGGRMPYDVESIVIDFNSYNHATIEHARELEVKVTERFIQAINTHEKIRPFLREYPFKADRAQVAISFNQQNNRHYTDGSVAFVFQARNIIFYRSDEENSPKLIPIMEEPYEDALKIVKNSSK